MRDAHHSIRQVLRRFLITSATLALAALAQHASARATSGRAGDPMRAPACVDARHELDATESALKPGQAPSSAALKRLRQKVADLCLRAEADTPGARVPAVPVVVPPVGASAGAATSLARPAVPTPPTIAPLPQPALPSGPTQVARCDANGCWDSTGARLNRSGPFLVNPQGRMCTQVGTIVQCP